MAVESASQIDPVVLKAVKDTDALIVAAAVADYRPADVAEQKIKRAQRAFLWIWCARLTSWRK